MADKKVTLKRVIDTSGNTDNIHPTTDWDQVEDKPSTFTPTAHNHAASEITSGTISTARLGSGTANSTTFLRGDNTWATVSASSGDIDGVTAGTGLTGGGTSGTVTLSIANAYSPNTAIELTSAQNLNDILTAGFYYQTANADTTGNNYPSGQAGSLFVQKSAGLVTQTYTTYTSPPAVYVRSYYTSWSSWVRMFEDNYHPNADTWTTARTLTVGDTGKSVNGSGNVSWSLTEIGAAAASHTHDDRYYMSGLELRLLVQNYKLQEQLKRML
jgi:hypothetical protein